jgi:hypothetical protein
MMEAPGRLLACEGEARHAPCFARACRGAIRRASRVCSLAPWRCDTLRCSGTYMNSACIVCIAGGLEGRRPSKKKPRMLALLQEIILFPQGDWDLEFDHGMGLKLAIDMGWAGEV